MLCEQIIGQVSDDAPGVDWVEIDWLLTLRRALRLTSRAGRRVNVLLPRNGGLRHGDVLAQVDGATIAVWVKPIDVLILRPTSIGQASRVAGALGNLHVPIEVEGDAIITPDDGPVRGLVADQAISIESAVRRFHPQIVDRSSFDRDNRQRV